MAITGGFGFTFDTKTGAAKPWAFRAAIAHVEARLVGLGPAIGRREHAGMVAPAVSPNETLAPDDPQ